MQRTVEVFKSLGDETRLRILNLLVEREVCVCDIHESLQISQPKASRHLAYLRRAGLVTDRKKGLWVHYRLAQQHDPGLSELLAAVARSIAALPQAGRDLERLAHRTGCCARPEQDGWTSTAST